MQNKATILLVEDDVNLGFVIKDTLEEEGFAVTHCPDGAAGATAFATQTFDLCVLDVMLPLKDGFTLASEIRAQNQQMPIIFLTAKALKEDRLHGFRLGADDYITKPFSIEELILRIEVFLRRSKPAASTQTPINQNNNEILSVGQYVLECNNLQLQHAAQTQQLTQREADLLKIFILNLNQTLRRDYILKALWGNDDYFNGRSLDVFISKLRKYLRHDDRIEIVNVHGVGFRLIVRE
ncbi:DNA-binding response regulator, OmpR family, contains REC and winged-helix (wHTH) domain [Flexibacter flexilis DSM 6793]|uniref:DNA-binding response regulator, OmpR family, contains REC and winged-helix (WHTH) domain n=1 Tax=Flexibacter flexilis DSM 6793 TaxID=927664 RepID=A0A1I1J1Y3_9BACT|nr:response regulator transcription factor [Flexibacter flexilis]SFC39470.1 DNA-binding response regulator, OmpR family, contains REC and winged-helix (wHTH) domain [Flexibacter flexilis DSM 6793]